MRFLLATLLTCTLATTPIEGQEGLKIYISADMEGLTAAVTNQQLGPAGFEYQKFRQIMTAEVNAAIEAARSVGATEFVVSDSHGNGQNLLVDQLPNDIQLIRSWPRPLGMMEGLDDSFDGVIFIGYHSSTTNPSGVRAHTFSSGNYAAVKLNGMPVPEAGFNAAIAGHFGVPILAISGDDAIIAEAKGILGDVEGAIVKWSYGFHSARTLMPEAGRQLIKEKVTTAIKRIADFTPFTIDNPVRLEVTFKNYMPAELASYLPNVDRVDAHTIGFTGADMLEVSKFTQFLVRYRANLEP